MALYLPGLGGLFAVVITWGIGFVLLLIGGAVCSRSAAAEVRIVAGWGALCLVLTLWGVFAPLSLRIPAVAIVAAAVLAQMMRTRRIGGENAAALGRLVLLTLPLWAVMAGVRPSQVDSFLNLLPNADYLVDYGLLPTATRPPSYSFLPAAPYDTQFLGFLGSLIWPDYPAAGMSLINVMLRLLAGLAIARRLTRAGGAPSWSALAFGVLLVTLLDPGFVPRFHFSAYGETALAVTALLAACLFVEARAGRARWVELALVLAAMINTKQSGIGLVLAVAGAGVVAVLAERPGQWRPVIGKTVLALVPAAVIYLVWRYHAARAGVAELEPLPLAAWNWGLLPTTFKAIAAAIAEKPTYFTAEIIAFSCLPLLLRRRGWSPATRVLTVNAAAFVLYNGFLVVTYIAHFSATMASEAHSYFRYNTHLSLILVLSLALAVWELCPAPLGRPRFRRCAVAAVIALALLGPLAFAGRLRFDLAMPQPVVWGLASDVKPYLKDGDRLALLLPGDDGEVGELLTGYLASAPPRRRGLDTLRLETGDASALDAAATRGYDRAFVSCTPGGLLGLPAGRAALLTRGDGGWQVAASWSLPEGTALSHWQRNRHWPALCR
jgi:hypothetical protein